MRVNNLFPEEGVLPGPAVKQPPIHPQVPDQRVQGADGGEDDEQVEEGVRVRMLLLWSVTKHTQRRGHYSTPLDASLRLIRKILEWLGSIYSKPQLKNLSIFTI